MTKYVIKVVSTAKDTNPSFAADGNTHIIEDGYGDIMREISIDDAIKIIEEASKNDNYRRYAPCLALLKSFDKSQWKNLVVLHYGY